MSETDLTITDEDLVAYADEAVEPARRAMMAAWCAAHPEDQRKVEQWRAQTAALRAALDPILAQPVPPAITAALGRRPRGMWGYSVAAGIALAIGFGAGWYAGGHAWPLGGVAGRTLQAFGNEGIDAHRVYVSEVRHPVEVGADEEAHLVAWLSKRLDFKIAAPDLTADGLKLLGGRLIPVDGQPGALLMYEGQSGERYSLFIARSDKPRLTSFRYEESGAYGTFYWIDGPGGYALTGPADRIKLLKIAQTVYDQLP
jgi:anti-sigma factor RsiW